MGGIFSGNNHFAVLTLGKAGGRKKGPFKYVYTVTTSLLAPLGVGTTESLRASKLPT